MCRANFSLKCAGFCFLSKQHIEEGSLRIRTQTIMPQIPIRSEEGNDNFIYFPVPEDGTLTLDDLRSGFPSIISLRYTDSGDDRKHQILCRNNAFVEPEGGWCKDGRVFLAVCGSTGTGPGHSRYSLFESYRRQTSTRPRQTQVLQQQSSTKKQDSDQTMITVGHGHFKNGKFSRISSASLSSCGGNVVVGPFVKSENTSEQIKKAAFQKLSEQNRAFRQKYTHSGKFYLVYPDGRLVDKLPDNSGEFTILGYRNYIDPMKRFDRLRLYLCEKKNFENNQPFEIISESSSDDELPELTFRATSNSTHRETHEENTENGSEPGASLTMETKSNSDDTLPLVIDVIYHYGDNKILETFPNNTKGGVLITCVERHLGWSCSLFELQLRGSDTLITSNDRLMELGSSSTLNINILEHQQSDTEIQHEIIEDDIPGDYSTSSTYVADSLVKATLKSLEGISDPLKILKKYQENFLQGRPLDVVCESETIEGETSAVFISRSTLFEDAIQEIKFQHNLRFPLECFFHGESAQDLGGPRREFFVNFLYALKERLVIEDQNNVCLTQNDEDLAMHRYFYAGLLLGLSIIEGGPTVDFLDSLIKNSTGEVKDQFTSGLSRIGIMQLINETKTVRYLFMPSTKTEMTVNAFLHLFKPDFSEQGTSRRVQEENAYGFFIRYLREVYSGRRVNVTLSKILKFATGASDVPVLGFTMEPCVDFADIIFPQASTCINRLTLPIDQKDFAKFDLAFVNDFFGME